VSGFRGISVLGEGQQEPLETAVEGSGAQGGQKDVLSDLVEYRDASHSEEVSKSENKLVWSVD